MEAAFSLGDDLGPAKVIHVQEPGLGLRATLVVDNVAAGPSIGGLRMAEDVSTEECARLARAMTLKNAAAGLPHGGGKSVLYGDPRMPRARKEALVRALARALRGCDDYIFGPDMGTDENAMAWVHDEIGRAVGLPRELGGIPLDQLGATGFGLRHAAEVALRHLGLALSGARFAVQGFGSVGIHAARFLGEQGALLVAASDSQGAIADRAGIDIGALVEHKRSGKGVAEFLPGARISAEELLAVDCEIWIPAARPDVIRAENAGSVRARLVLSGANIPATDAAERILHERGVLLVPDFIANAGGVICAAMEWRGETEAAAFAAIAERIRTNTAAVLERGAQRHVPLRQAAVELAGERLRRAMATRRFSIF